MNQILEVKKNKSIYKIQLYISIIAIIIFSVSFFIYKYNLNKKESISESLLKNYSISKLYSNSSINSDTNADSNVIGIIEIPKLKISYPIFSGINDELLKISPCRFYGSMPYSISNLCIAGHNYNNNKFFSNINQLTSDDYVIIYNNSMKKFTYIVTDNYEVESNDLSPIFSKDDNNIASLTLVTCNNINKKRIIVKAIIENP